MSDSGSRGERGRSRSPPPVCERGARRRRSPGASRRSRSSSRERERNSGKESDSDEDCATRPSGQPQFREWLYETSSSEEDAEEPDSTLTPPSTKLVFSSVQLRSEHDRNHIGIYSMITSDTFTASTGPVRHYTSLVEKMGLPAEQLIALVKASPSTAFAGSSVLWAILADTKDEPLWMPNDIDIFFNADPDRHALIDGLLRRLSSLLDTAATYDAAAVAKYGRTVATFFYGGTKIQLICAGGVHQHVSQSFDFGCLHAEFDGSTFYISEIAQKSIRDMTIGLPTKLYAGPASNFDRWTKYAERGFSGFPKWIFMVAYDYERGRRMRDMSSFMDIPGYTKELAHAHDDVHFCVMLYTRHVLIKAARAATVSVTSPEQTPQ